MVHTTYEGACLHRCEALRGCLVVKAPSPQGREYTLVRGGDSMLPHDRFAAMDEGAYVVLPPRVCIIPFTYPLRPQLECTF